MDTFSIESFLTIVNRGSFSEAARTLAITQPALSQRIKLMEEELGYSLFIRQKGQRLVELTGSGKEFLQYAWQIQNIWNSAKGLKKDNPTETLNVSIIESVLSCVLPNIGEAFNQSYPDIQLSVSSYYSKEAYQHIDDGSIDCAIVMKHLNTRNGIVVPLFFDPYVFVCGKDDDYPSTVHPGDLDPQLQLTLLSIEKTDWHEYWFPQNSGVKLAGTTINFMNSHLFSNHEWTILPASVARHMEEKSECSIHTLDDAPPPRMIYAILADNDRTYTIKKFLNCIYDELKKMPDITLTFQED